jgi:pimeloyl-ACP methyl ester carboxylesterase
MLAEDLSGELGAITAPTFLMWGDQDGLADRETQERISGAIPGAQLVIYRGCGHSVQWERPDRIAADITAFVTASVGIDAARRKRRNAA